MTALLVSTLVVAVALAAIAWRGWSRARRLQGWLDYASRYVVRSGAPFQEIEPVLFASDWVLVAQGGNNKAGTIGGLGNCPCQSEYTVNTVQQVINAWPNPAVVAGCAANPPAADPAVWKCPADCVQVWTHVWHGWDVVRNRKTGQLKFNCNTFAQYHCKKPDDPARDKPPVQGHPDDVQL